MVKAHSYSRIDMSMLHDVLLRGAQRYRQLVLSPKCVNTNPNLWKVVFDLPGHAGAMG